MNTIYYLNYQVDKAKAYMLEIELLWNWITFAHIGET